MYQSTTDCINSNIVSDFEYKSKIFTFEAHLLISILNNSGDGKPQNQ